VSLAQLIRDEIELLADERRELWKAGKGKEAAHVGFRIDDLYAVLRLARSDDTPELRRVVNVEYDPESKHMNGAPTSKVKASPNRSQSKLYAQGSAGNAKYSRRRVAA
jgi:hypothetical protein